MKLLKLSLYINALATWLNIYAFFCWGEHWWSFAGALANAAAFGYSFYVWSRYRG